MLEKKPKEAIPEIMTGVGAVAKIQELRDDIVRSKPQLDRTKFEVMEGMQNPDKVAFFTEFIDDNDVLRINTIESYVTIAPLIVKKAPPQTIEKIAQLMIKVYDGHVQDHKTNMTSKGRGREIAYTKILSHDTTEEIVPTGIKRFFGFGKGGSGK